MEDTIVGVDKYMADYDSINSQYKPTETYRMNIMEILIMKENAESKKDKGWKLLWAIIMENYKYLSEKQEMLLMIAKRSVLDLDRKARI